MISPFDLVLDPISLTVFAIYAVLVLWEAFMPARPLPAVAGWRLRGLGAFAAYFFLSSYLPLFWGGTLATLQVFDLTGLGKWRGALVGIFLYEAAAYGWHRSMHRSKVLWRGFHQMHHSAERLDTYGAFWFSPLDMLGWIVLGSVCLTILIGITPEAATLVLYTTTFFSIFQHANVRTPRWLGYLVQRPESHSHHHQRGVCMPVIIPTCRSSTFSLGPFPIPKDSPQKQASTQPPQPVSGTCSAFAMWFKIASTDGVCRGQAEASWLRSGDRLSNGSFPLLWTLAFTL